MNVVKNQVAQGDVLVRRVDRSPEDVRKLAQAHKDSKDGAGYIVGHSETGHHHTLIKLVGPVELYDEPVEDGPARKVLVLGEGASTVLQHERGWDTHEPHLIEGPGVFEIRRQREYVPEGWRAVQD